MKRTARIIAAFTCATSITLAFGTSFSKPKNKKQPTINTDKWIVATLPFHPFNIAAQGSNNLWICGLDEAIAVSDDGGTTWHIQHLRQNGEILLNIAFVNDKVGHAAGTGGLVLTTIDGGQTWEPHTSGATIKNFSFSGPLNGIAEIDDHVSLTSDGGEHWHVVTAMQTDTAVRTFSDIESVAALSATHLAISLHQPEGEEIYLATVDGGKTWVPTHVLNTFADYLAVHDREYWAFGIEYLGREHDPHGGYSAPVALHSKDAHIWQHGVRASTEFNACTAQGCSLSYGVIEDMFGATEKIWSLPQNISLTRKWAMAGARVCMIGNGLYCATALASDSPPPMPDTPGGVYTYVAQNHPPLDDCVDCEFKPIFRDPDWGVRSIRIEGIDASFDINRDGSVSNVRVTGIPGKIVSNEIAQQISKWLIAPAHQGAETVGIQKQIKLNMLCFPDFPGHPGSGYCSISSGATQGGFESQ